MKYSMLLLLLFILPLCYASVSTEFYYVGEPAIVSGQLLTASYQPDTTSIATFTIRYPNGTFYIDNASMIHIGEGLYTANFTPTVSGTFLYTLYQYNTTDLLTAQTASILIKEPNFLTATFVFFALFGVLGVFLFTRYKYLGSSLLFVLGIVSYVYTSETGQVFSYILTFAGFILLILDFFER